MWWACCSAGAACEFEQAAVVEVQPAVPSSGKANAGDVKESDDRERQAEEVEIAGSWRLKGALATGSITAVTLAVNMKGDEEAAVRSEDKDSELGGLAREAVVLKKLHEKCGGKTGFAAFHHFGLEGGRHILVTELLGPSLEKLRKECGGRFCQKTVCFIGLQLLYRLEGLHDLGFLHRAISPENIRVGRGNDAETLYLTDFTQAKMFKSNAQHIPYTARTSRRSTPSDFSSVNMHMGAERSRRDDLESLALVLAYCLSGKLPWQDLEAAGLEAREDREDPMADAKRSASIDQLACGLLPLQEMLLYCRSLWFEANPNYQLLRRGFRRFANTLDSGEGKGMFCWSPNGCSRSSHCQEEGRCPEGDSEAAESTVESTAVGSGLSRSWSMFSSRSRNAWS